MRLRANEQTYEVVGRPAGVTQSPDGDLSRYRDAGEQGVLALSAGLPLPNSGEPCRVGLRSTRCSHPGQMSKGPCTVQPRHT
jgi:hypothetical protein